MSQTKTRPTDRFDFHEERVLSYVAARQWSSAKKVLANAEKEARKASDEDGSTMTRFELSCSIMALAHLLRGREEFQEAASRYSEALSFIGEDAVYRESCARIHASRAFCLDMVDAAAEASSAYEQAITLFEALDPPGILDVADLSNNLAFLYKEQNQIDQAEDCFLKALEIFREHLGEEDEQTATLFNNLGALYTQSGDHSRAREMHTIALKGRCEALGDSHPDTAQSHANLAISLAKTGELELAARHFETSIEIFQQHRAACAEDLEVVEANFQEFQQASVVPVS